jgi:hypothetical protein
MLFVSVAKNALPVTFPLVARVSPETANAASSVARFIAV